MKVEEGPNGLAVAYGLCTSEAVDCDNERCNYDGTKPYYQKWSGNAIDTTVAAGQEVSCGNIRIMHTTEVGGKAVAINFDDTRKQVWIKTEAKDEAISDQLRRGIYKSFSQGGKYVRRWCGTCDTDVVERNYCPTCKKNIPVVDYIASISEVSYVDLGANPEANFVYVKADGSTELRKFFSGDESVGKAKKTKRVAGEDLTADCFAYVGDPEKTDTWKLPIKFSTEAKTIRHIRNALARLGQTKGIPAGEKAKVKAKIVAAAKKHGIEVTEESEKVARYLEAAVNKAVETAGLKKGLYDVARFAELVQSMAYLWSDSEWEAEREGDDSEIPEQLREIIDSMAAAFLGMSAEELAELTEKAASAELAKAKGELMNEELFKAARKGLAGLCKGMGKLHKMKVAEHEKAAASNKAMADAHKDAMESCAMVHKMHKDAISDEPAADADGVASDPENSNQDHELMAQHYGAMVSVHKAAHAFHMAESKRHEKMHKAHGAMLDMCHNVASSQDDGDGAKAALVAVEKAASVEIDVEPATLQAGVDFAAVIAALGEANKAHVEEIRKANAEGMGAMKAQIAALQGEVEKATVVPGKLTLVPRDATKAAGSEREPVANRIAV